MSYVLSQDFLYLAAAMVMFLVLLWVAYGVYEKRRHKRLQQLQAALKQQQSTIANHKIEQVRLQTQTVHDASTATYNRDTILELLHLEVQRSQRYLRPCSIMLVEIDHFDLLGTNYGFDATSKIAADLACHCRQQLRPFDVIGRVAGNQFLLILVEVDTSNCDVIANRLHEVVGGSPVQHETHQIGYTIRMAWRTLTADHVNSQQLLQECRQALV